MTPVPVGAGGPWPSDLLPPPFAAGHRPGLMDVLSPLVLRPEPGRDVVVLLDGVGSELLAEHRALTPTLRALESSTRSIRTVHPSTTATAMVSLHTGSTPLEHGVLGYTTWDPERRRVLNQITGDPAVAPERWVPWPTPPPSRARVDRLRLQVAPARHRGSHLSRVAYRGWEFVPHGRHDRADVMVIAARRAGGDGLVHLHVDDVDHAGHHHGVDSEAWREALAEADALIGTLLRRLPRGTRLHVTADHGMVDTTLERTVDLGTLPGLALRSRVAAVAGEPRSVSLHLHDPREAADLAPRLQDALADRALVLTREEALTGGLWAPPGTAIPEQVEGRLPELVLLARGSWALEADATSSEPGHRMIGMHGSLTAAEAVVPLVQAEI